jgi:hypothetical protein
LQDLTKESDRLIREARLVRDDNRLGGRHRLSGRRSIGRGSADLKQRNMMTRIKLIAGSLFAVVIASSVLGIALDGIGFTGIMVAFLAIVAATFLFSNFPKVKVPTRDEINRGDVRQLVGRTELWLEAQRPALPAPAVQVVDGIGVQLDALGLQLEGLDQSHPSAVEIRKLVGETLPEMVDSYRRIPANLRTELRAGGKAPNDQLTEGLGKISNEIDSITRQLAQGSLDDLAIKHRYLDYKYGDAEEIAGQIEDKRS